jgi:XTP/dITP diphosphohydrolase
MKSLIIATANKGKFEEIKQLLTGRFDLFYSLADFEEKVAVEEDRHTYLENAWKKARKIGDRYDMQALADDSGLEVEALGGKPGIYSSRYGLNDRERIDRLLDELRGVPLAGRGAMFKAYLAYYVPHEERVYFFYGSLKGYIGLERHGEKGFGFDPVFMLPGADTSLAQLTVEEKNRISHRGRALAAFVKFLSALS